MDQSFDIEFRGDHLHVELVPGYEPNSETRDQFWKELARLCAEHKTRRVFVEGFVPEGERPTTEVIDAGQHTAAVPNLWLAFCLDGFVRSDQSELFEVIAASRGVRVKFFSDTEHALRWLRNNAPA